MLVEAPRQEFTAKLRLLKSITHLADELEDQTNINAAANIASRFGRGERAIYRLSGRDDSPQDGSILDSATAHRELSALLVETCLAFRKYI